MGAILKAHESEILRDWIASQLADTSLRELLNENEVNEQSRSFLALFSNAAQNNYDEDLAGQQWDDVRAALSSLS
jgi:hypothetical protein